MKRQRWFQVSVAVIIGIGLLLPSNLRSESSQPLRVPFRFNQAGAVFFPKPVLAELVAGKLSPILQFAIMNQMMSGCVRSVVKRPPGRRTAYVKAKARFEDGLCRIKKCFQNGIILSLLSGTSSNPRFGGAHDKQEQESNRQQALMMLTGFQKDDKCGGEGEGFDPLLLLALQGKNVPK